MSHERIRAVQDLIEDCRFDGFHNFHIFRDTFSYTISFTNAAPNVDAFFNTAQATLPETSEVSLVSDILFLISCPIKDMSLFTGFII